MKDLMISIKNDSRELFFASPGNTTRRVLNVGSGQKSVRRLKALFDPADWTEIRIDLNPAVEPDVIGSMTDLRAHFDRRTFDAIWSSHSLEHLHNHEIPTALTEFRRALKDDGFAIITCPDLEIVMTLFLEHGPDHVVYQSAAGPITPPLDMMFGHSPSIASGHVHMAHRSGLTSERLGGLLLQAGFFEVVTKRQDFDLWALALMEHADREAIHQGLRAAGFDLSGDPE
jgi:predicted SAM-dependent methyltransferase